MPFGGQGLFVLFSLAVLFPVQMRMWVCVFSVGVIFVVCTSFAGFDNTSALMGGQGGFGNLGGLSGGFCVSLK